MFKLKWIGQGGYILTLGNKTLCIDPYLSNSVFHLDDFNRIIPIPIQPDELDVDLIISTHDHMDHLDEETLKYTDYNNTIYTGPDSCVKHFKEMGIKEEKLFPLNAGNTIILGDAIIYGVYADHTEDSIGVIVDYNEIKIYFVGDSLFNEKLFKVKKKGIDIIVTCINGKLGNMDYVEAANLSKKLEVKIGIPCHYGMFEENTEDPKKYEQELAGSGVKYIELEVNKDYDVEHLIYKTNLTPC